MKRIMYILVSIFVMNLSFVLANNEDTGWIKFTQPDKTEFTGRGWGDEFEFYWETEDGYRFVKNCETDFWCYAVLSEKGDFKASKFEVGKINPASVGIEKKMEFSAAFKAEIA